MPNPAGDYLNVNLYSDQNSEQVSFILFDKVGKKVLIKTENLTKGFNNITLNLDKLSGGSYILSIQTNSERIVRQIVIIK